MKSRILAAAMLAGLLASGAAWADSNCDEPVANWQPRGMLRQQLEQRGWTVQRIKVDDGCYEVRGTDRLGNRVKAKYGPASLRIRKLEIDFSEGGDASGYLDQGQKTN
ncbi:PepSY domain-containing protein [Polaromonas sp.]|uniref:PepSY domain-containing protein n=1 Tax=Polaromonas sp. TaxID=1869339 RepID=UPI0013BA0091|nr:PepSY domain-containing protein [Polaromonas sp.]NDP62129.1 PepSY domain-containing protein [Polaromonas sp.]